jgi:hypothetical protein
MTKFTSVLLCVTLGALALPAAPLTETAAVHTRPDVGAPTITFLKAGSEPVLAPDSLGLTPAGWLAVELPGPFEAYVQNKDIGKSLDVQPGASIHQHPRTGSTVITTMEPGDKASITGLHGKWTQIQLEKKITGYVRVSGGVMELIDGSWFNKIAADAPWNSTETKSRNSSPRSPPSPAARPASPSCASAKTRPPSPT